MLEVDQVGDFKLSFSSISYKTEITQIKIDSQQLYKIDQILKDENFALDEIIINSERAITIKEDTIIYNAKSFKKGNEESVEDLLKNIPGINIDDDGKIKIGNREIEKILVEGDDLFGKEYKLLSKNLDASAIAKVEVYDKYSNNRLLKNVEQSNNVAINLKLTQDTKNQLFGVLRPGYGLGYENRYQSKASIISFTEKFKTFLFTDANNTGIDVSGDLDQLENTQETNSFTDFETNSRAVSFINLFRVPTELGRERTNFNNSEMISINNVYTVNDKLKLKASGFFNWDERDFNQKNVETFLLTDTNITNSESYSLIGKQFIGYGKTSLTYDISSDKLLEYSGTYNSTRLNTRSNLIFNTTPTNEKLTEKQFSTQHNIEYTSQLKDKKVFQIKGNFFLIKNHKLIIIIKSYLENFSI